MIAQAACIRRADLRDLRKWQLQLLHANGTARRPRGPRHGGRRRSGVSTRQVIRSCRWSGPGIRRAKWAPTPLRRYLKNRRILRYSDVPTKLAVELTGSRRAKG